MTSRIRRRRTDPARASTPPVVPALVAIVLGGAVIALAVLNPLALIGLGPVLLAVAAVVRAVTGTR